MPGKCVDLKKCPRQMTRFIGSITLVVTLLMGGCHRTPEFTTPDGRGWRVNKVCACPGGFHLGRCVSTRLDTTQVRSSDGPLDY